MPSSVLDANGSGRVFTLREMMIALAGLVLIFFALIHGRVNSTVVLITSSNESMPFPDMEASFAPRIPGAGLLGVLYASNPPDACQQLHISPPSLKFPYFPFVIVARGECTFETKVQHAQNAGFAAVIVYNNEDNEDLITMSGNPSGISIPAVFVAKAAGDVLLNYVGDLGTRCYILPSSENTAWSVMAVSFISLLAVTAVLATFFFVRRHRLRHLGSRLRPRESLSMSSREVKALPSFLFKCVGDGNATNETCAICLEDYETDEKLRILPCHHDFHATCIDQWLTTRRPFCPICKRDARSKIEGSPPSETTPLLNAVSSASLPIGRQTSAAIHVSPPNSVHLTSSIGSLDGSYTSSPSGVPIEVHTHVAGLEASLEDSPVGSPSNDSYLTSVNSQSLSAGASISGQCNEQAVHSSDPDLQASPANGFSRASQANVGLRSASYSSSDILRTFTSGETPNRHSPSRLYFRAAPLDASPNLSNGSQSDLHALRSPGMDQC